MISAIARLGITLVSVTALTACSSGGGGGGGGGDGGGGGNPPPSRNAQTIVYSAGDGLSTNGVTELYSVDDDGNGRTMLSADTALDTTSIQDLAVSPDGLWVAYVSNIRSPGETDLYVSAINGGTPVRVSRTKPILGGRIQSFDWSPDSSQLVYAANVGHSRLPDMATNEVFVVNRDGSNDTKINGAIGNPAVVEVRNPQWSPDGRYILQEVAAFNSANGASNVANALNVHDTTVGGFSSVRVVTAYNTLRNVHWSPMSDRLSFSADLLGPSRYHVFTSEPFGTGMTKVSDNGDFNSDSRWSPDGSTLAYLDHPSLPFPGDLVVSGASPGSPDTVLAFVTPDGKQVYDYAWSPDGSKIAFTSDLDTPRVRELYVINADGTGNPVKISGPLIATGDVFDFAWSPNGNSIAYLADQDTDTFIDLYVSSANGGNNTSISMGLNGEEVTDFDWSDDSQRIAFSTGPEGRNPLSNKLYVSQPNGSGRREITPAMTSGPLIFEYN